MDVAPEHPPEITRILYVITKGTWGGAQRYVYELAVAAKRQGALVSVALGTPGELVGRLEEAKIPVIFVPGLARDIRLGSDVRAFLALYRLMRREHPEVVHANSSKAGLIAVLAARLARVPRIIFTAHGWAWNELRPGWQKFAFKLLHLLTVWGAHSVIAVSQAIQTDASWMPGTKRKFVTIRHGISPLPSLPQAEARAKLLTLLGPTLPEKAFWIGALAELHPTKGLDVLIRAFAPVALRHPETIVVLIGSGQDRGRLTALAHMLHLDGRVFFAGHVENAAAYLSALDVFAFPSHSEALGYALLEAGQASLPSVASAVGGIPEIVVNEESGLLVPAGDEDALGLSLLRLIEEPATRARLGAALHTRVLTDFGEMRMLRDTFTLYVPQD